jgi:outer membrane protein assembly factor BamE (lipoprotein component of BamABCDE complex)
MPLATKKISHRPLRRVVACGALGVATIGVMTMPGCIASGSSHVSSEGRYIGHDTLTKIEPGETTKEWVLAVLGTPTNQTTLDDGTQIWKWSSKKVTKSKGSVFLLVRGSSRDVTERTVYVEFEDEIVKRAWKD